MGDSIQGTFKTGVTYPRHRDADRLLAEHRDTLEGLAQALLKAESLDETEIRGVTGLTVRLPDTRRAWDRSTSGATNHPRGDRRVSSR